MAIIVWDKKKNAELKVERGVSFEDVLVCIENEQILAIRENPSKKYKEQMIFIIGLKDYIYYVPFVQQGEDIFLKTIIPSRKLVREFFK